MLLRIGFVWTALLGAFLPSVSAAEDPGAAPTRALLFTFTAQDDPKTPHRTHTWGVLVHCRGDEVVATETISWMPATGAIRTPRLWIEPGVNLSHEATMDWCRRAGIGRVTVWGPVEASPVIVARFAQRRAQLESGALGYQCIDFVGQAALTQRGCNCVGALDAVAGFTPMALLQSYGDASGALLNDVLLYRRLATLTSFDPALLQALGCGPRSDGLWVVHRDVRENKMARIAAYGALH